MIQSFVDKLDAAGVDVTQTETGIRVKRRADHINAVDVRTEVFPGFPTDLQAQMMALMCTAKGVRTLKKRFLKIAFMHAPELMRMGANIDVNGGTATVTGVGQAKGAPVMATDLRASVSLILAGLAAEGQTKVSRVYHLDRGYEKLVQGVGVGAKVERISE